MFTYRIAEQICITYSRNFVVFFADFCFSLQSTEYTRVENWRLQELKMYIMWVYTKIETKNSKFCWCSSRSRSVATGAIWMTVDCDSSLKSVPNSPWYTDGDDVVHNIWSILKFSWFETSVSHALYKFHYIKKLYRFIFSFNEFIIFICFVVFAFWFLFLCWVQFLPPLLVCVVYGSGFAIITCNEQKMISRIW